MKLAHFVITLTALTTTIACGDDDAAANAKAAAAACNPAGTFNLARAQFTATGGQFCTDNAAISNQAAQTRVFVATKNADGTFSWLKQGDNDDGFKKMTLNTATCTLTATETEPMMAITDMSGGFGYTTDTQTATVAFTNNNANVTYQLVRDFSAAASVSGNVTSVPCKLTSNTTGTKM